MSIQIVVKNPSASVGDFKLEMSSSDTVRQLKSHLCEFYPGNPAIERQKLIFSGKLLVDSNTLAETFKQNDLKMVQTIHIVVSKMPSPSEPQPNVQQTPIFGQQNFQPQNFQMNHQQFLQQQFLHQQRLAAQQFAQFQHHLRAQQMAHPQQQNQIPQPQQGNERHRESPFWLILKLSFMVYILSQGGSTSRVAALSIGAFVIYLYQTGLLRIATNHLPNAQATQNLPPGQRGLVAEFILPFFYSLLPNWQPVTNHEAPQPPAPMDQVIG